jgi:hypothetical protein
MGFILAPECLYFRSNKFKVKAIIIVGLIFFSILCNVSKVKEQALVELTKAMGLKHCGIHTLNPRRSSNI